MPVRSAADVKAALFDGLLTQQMPMAPDLIGQTWWSLADPGIRVDGCGAACDCCWYARVDCAFGVHVRKIGDRFFVCGRENFFLEGEELILREADPGFKPLPEDLD
jgi:hypothetical protein